VAALVAGIEGPAGVRWPARTLLPPARIVNGNDELHPHPDWPETGRLYTTRGRGPSAWARRGRPVRRPPTAGRPAAKMAILARWPSNNTVHLDQVPLRGIEQITGRRQWIPRDLGLGINLIDAERVNRGGSSVLVASRVPILRAVPPLASVNSVQRRTIESAGDHRDHPRARAPAAATAERRPSRRHQRDDPARSTPRTTDRLDIVSASIRRPSTCTSRSADRPGVLAQGRPAAGAAGRVDSRFVQKGWGRTRLVMGHTTHPLLDRRSRRPGA